MKRVLGTILKVPTNIFSSGYAKIVAVDNTPRHPSPNMEYWNYIIVEYNEGKIGTKEVRLTEKTLQEFEA